MSFLVEPIVSALMDNLLKPLMRQVRYIVKEGESIKALDTAMRRLKERSDDLVARIRASQERDPSQQPTSEVDGLLQSVQQVECEVTAIKAMYGRSCKFMGGCSCNIYSGYKIGRKTTKKHAIVRDLYDKAGALADIDVTRPQPSPPGQQMPGTSNLLAIDSNINRILGLLADASAANDKKGLTVGIWGMGGVGKTTLLKAINNKLSTCGGVDGVHFDRVIWVVVSNNAQIQKVQADISNVLKLQLPNAADARACQDCIFNFLKNKRFVILLDDLWERLDLDGIGIPDHRVVIFTTRSEAVCGQMEADKKVKVECLQEEEAWSLFKAKVGDMSPSPEIQKLAKAVAEECKGLPLALVLIGRAMASKHSREEWQHAFTSLTNSQPGPGTHTLFHTLKFSYDSLPDEATRLGFLLCALFPEDFDLFPTELIDLFLGHDLIDVEGCSNAGEIYDRGYDRILGVLESSCLLESYDESTWPGGLKMHDVVRDMALWIARETKKWVVRAGLDSKEPLKGVNDWEMAEKLSLDSNGTTDLPVPKRVCEKLSTLILTRNYQLKSIPKNFFTYFPALSYLDLSVTGITELPEEVSSLTELQFLNLTFTKIEALNMSLKNLKKLKHLSLDSCPNLDYIPYGLLSCLPMLQFLDICSGPYIFKSENFTGEEDGDGSSYIVGESEKEGCENRGDQEFMRSQVVPRKANLQELKVLKERQQLKSLGLNLEMKTILDLQKFVDVRCIMYLKLVALQDSRPEDVIETLLMVAHSLEYLKLRNFRRLKELILTKERVRGEIGLNDCFRRLYDLELVDHSGLIKITWNKSMLIEMFPRLTRVKIKSCHDLQNLTWTGYLPGLRYLIVRNCRGLKQIIDDDEDDEDLPQLTNSSIFPRLRDLNLQDLAELQRISNAIFDSPQLNYLYVDGCPALKRISFSFQEQITKKIKFHLRCERAWLEGLEWEDENIKSYLQPFVDLLDSEGEEASSENEEASSDIKEAYSDNEKASSESEA